MGSSETLELISPICPSEFENYWAIVQGFSILYLSACEGLLLVVYIYKYVYVYKQMYSELKQVYSQLFVCWEFISADTGGQVFSKIFCT